jgi:hypothetical protein
MLKNLEVILSFLCISLLLATSISAQDLIAADRNFLGNSSSPSAEVAELSPAKGLFGIGVVLGEPSGVSGKYWLSKYRAVDGAFGYSFGDRFRFTMDYLVQTDELLSKDFSFYYGIGGSISGGRGYIAKPRPGDFALGARGVIGVSHFFKRAPLDAFLELAPIIFIAPPLGLSIDFCFGVRVYP